LRGSVTFAGADALEALVHILLLKWLNISVNDIGGEVVQRFIVALKNLPHLTNLDLVGCALGDAGAVMLSSMPFMPRLHTLILFFTGIGVEGMRATGRND
jgi:hypothetical protein